MSETQAQLGDIAQRICELPSFETGSGPPRDVLRPCLAGIALGAAEELAALPLVSDMRDVLGRNRDLTFAGALLEAATLGTLGASADLDPLDAGPAHVALPVAAAVAALAPLTRADDSAVEEAVSVGCEAGAILRGAVTGARPGLGFHSPGTFGLFGATAACARLLGLRAAQTEHALALSLTRMSGLASNNAATSIGLTHFGWAAAHGLECARLASLGETSSGSLAKGLSTLFPGSAFEFPELPPAAVWPGRVIYKRYPCNIYLNPLVDFVQENEDPSTWDTDIRIVLPNLPHLDDQNFPTARQARNSAQAVVLLAATGPHNYDTFTERTIRKRGADLRELAAAHVAVELTQGPSDLMRAQVGINVRRDDRGLVFLPVAMQEAWRIGYAAQLGGRHAGLLNALDAAESRVAIDLLRQHVQNSLARG